MEEKQIHPSVPGIWTPIEAFANPLLTPTEKYLYGSLQYLNSRYEGGTTVKNQQLADFLCVSVTVIEKSLKSLEDLGYITRETHTETIRVGEGSNRKDKIIKSRRIHDTIDPVWKKLAEIWNRAMVEKDPEYSEYFSTISLKLRNGIRNIKEVSEIITQTVGDPLFKGSPPLDLKGSRPFKSTDYYNSSNKEVNKVDKNFIPRTHVRGSVNGDNEEDIVQEENNGNKLHKPSNKDRMSKISQQVQNFVQFIYSKWRASGRLSKLPSETDFRHACETVDKLIRIDGHDLKKDILPALEWAVQDSFWSDQIFSLSPLRNKSRNNGNTKFENILRSYNSAKKCHTKEKNWVRPGGTRSGIKYREPDMVI